MDINDRAAMLEEALRMIIAEGGDVAELGLAETTPPPGSAASATSLTSLVAGVAADQITVAVSSIFILWSAQCFF